MNSVRSLFRFGVLGLMVILIGGCFATVTYRGGQIGGRIGGDLDPGESGTSAPAEGQYEDGEIIQTGMASWYGGKFHGRETASGEIYDKWAMTAAHRTLPLGTRLVVERISNGKAVEVKVNDRGPYVDGRILDLSRGAARQLNMVDDGVAKVRLYKVGGSDATRERTTIGSEEPTEDDAETEEEAEISGRYTIQVGSFTERANAVDLKARLEGQFEDVHVTTAYDRYFRVRVGTYRTEAEAELSAEGLRQMGLETWVVREN